MGARGSGPGSITDDGCAVDLYKLLPTRGEAELVHGAVVEGVVVLELGCGTGRITRGLVSLGHPVVAVDSSAEMLARLDDLPDVEAVQAGIKALHLERRFPAVLLASNLVNSPEQGLAFLTTSEEHLAPGGRVVVEQFDPRWVDPAWAKKMAGPSQAGPATIEIPELEIQGAFISGRQVARVGERTWTQTYTCLVLDDGAGADLLGQAGLKRQGWLTDDHRWFVAGRAEVRQ